MNIPLIIMEFKAKYAAYCMLAPQDHIVVTVSASDGTRSIESRLRGLGTHALGEVVRGLLLDVGRAGTARFSPTDDEGRAEPIEWQVAWRS